MKKNIERDKNTDLSDKNILKSDDLLSTGTKKLKKQKTAEQNEMNSTKNAKIKKNKRATDADHTKIEMLDCPNNQSDAKRSKHNKRMKRLAVALCLLIAIPALVAGSTMLGFVIWADTLTIDTSKLPTSSAAPIFYDSSGNEIETETSEIALIENVPINVQNAFVALEDKRFYSHHGVDVIRIAGAMLSNIKSGAMIEGGSTITQQLIKNTHLTHEKTYQRKLNEIGLAKQLEKMYSKEDILKMYLSVIYFGSGAYGIKDASETYFGKTIDELTLSESACLAGIIKNPTKNSPKNGIDNATNRRNLVLNLMREQNYISDQELIDAKSEKIVLTDRQNVVSTKMYIAKAKEQVLDFFDITEFELNNSGMQIYTNLDPIIQANLAREQVDANNFKSVGTDSVSIVFDNKKEKVLGYSSTLNYDIKRQAGSILKPLAVYAPLLNEKQITLMTPVVDEMVNFNGYSPKNYGDIYIGNTNPLESIKKSINSVAVKLMDYLTPQKSARYLRSFGINIANEDQNYSLALGATKDGIRPLDLTLAYASLANHGVMPTCNFVNYITRNGKKIYQSSTSQNQTESNSTIDSYSAKNHFDFLQYDGKNRYKIDKSTAKLINFALYQTAQMGTAKSLKTLPFSVASKTGTVELNNNGETYNTDAYNVSYTPDHTVFVWHGGDKILEKGGGHPTLHAKNILRQIYSQLMPDSFEFECDGTTEFVEIDNYLTSQLEQVVKKNDWTSKSDTLSALFATDNMPRAIAGYDQIMQENDFDLAVKDNKASISFYKNDVFDYILTRTIGNVTTTIFDSQMRRQNALYDKLMNDMFKKRTDTVQISKTKDNKVQIVDDLIDKTGIAIYSLKISKKSENNHMPLEIEKRKIVYIS